MDGLCVDSLSPDPCSLVGGAMAAWNLEVREIEIALSDLAATSQINL